MLTKEENNVFRIDGLVNGHVGKAITCFVLDVDFLSNVSCLPSKQEEGIQ
jgi:hypothetical protein